VQGPGKITARNEREALLKVFLAGRIAVEAEGMVIDERHFPGRQGRLLFAYLVAEPGRAVPRDELADVLWGDTPPATWEKALSVLVSKLRSLLAEAGIDGATALTAAFGCYRLELPNGTWVDVLAAENAAREAERFLSADKLEEASAAAALAESLTGSPFLPGDDGPWVEAKRRELAGVRSRALGTLAAASLESGNAAEAVRWAELAIEAEPFRESGYRRLMEAHVAAGNRAEALQVYERCRRLLADELGAYPSPETESIYRGLLEAPAGRTAAETTEPTTIQEASASSTSRRIRPALLVAVLAVLVAVGAAIAVIATRADGAGAPSVARVQSIALVVPPTPLGSMPDPSVAQYQAALEQAARTEDGVQTRTFAIDSSKPGLPQELRNNIDSFGLVLLAAGPANNRFADVIAQHPHTRFVLMDARDNHDLRLSNAITRDANADDLFFATGPTAYLAGYLGALMGKRADPGKRQTVVSMIVSDYGLNENEITGFSDGVVNAGQGTVLLRVNSSRDASDPSVCERIADRLIDEGATTIYADAGDTCSPGAISTARSRGVWAIGSNPSVHGPGILGSTIKRLDIATGSVITEYLQGTLQGLKHHHFDVGIERGVIALTNLNSAVPTRIRAKLAQVKQQTMSVWKTYATPQN
jgi:DNA-binding SARP family transcriptional activator/basic membrane lipoprotein Med (substrate-binding protein (PBP1-ABC) superfamily)